jgi:hypothetical protein
MANYSVGDRVVNVNIRHTDFDERATVTGNIKSHFHGDGVNVKKDFGGSAQWLESDIKSTV